VDFRTAVAQAELEDREQPGAYHRVRFARPDGGFVAIDTTRPELIPACVALVAHPDDERYRPIFGSEVVTPLFGAHVPVRAHALADPEKGTGVAMICTFGDVTDVVWWRELGLPVRGVIQPNGTFKPVTWGQPGWESQNPGRAQQFYDQIASLSAVKARARIVDLLRESGDLVGDPKPVTHAVKFYEKGDRPLEIITSRQWFIKTMEHRERLLQRGREIKWHPPYMQARYENWINGLAGDWCISRQRFFGVPFPVWYQVREDGTIDYDSRLQPDHARLPIDPSTDVPDGYSNQQRDKPGGFTGDPDIMDTWATSSLTPHIAAHWEDDAHLFGRVFPMDLRPQAHDIIRTWLFNTVLRSDFEHGVVPWTNAAISGFVLDPDRKKMSKSKGNVVTPLGLLEEHGSDGVRYWAASGRPGTDTAFDTGQMKVGRRLAIKLLNASRFVLSRPEPSGAATAHVDRGLLTMLARVVEESTQDLDGYNYTRALERCETFFWSFCDDYLELVKGRRYGDQGAALAASANGALLSALSVMLRMFAPFLPFAAEEVWSWWRPGSVHTSRWPEAGELLSACEPRGEHEHGVRALHFASQVLGAIRKKKSEEQRGLKTAVARAVIRAPKPDLTLFADVERDLRAAGLIQQLETADSESFQVDVELAPPDAQPAPESRG
jgi:valyl-tRNA synthetase